VQDSFVKSGAVTDALYLEAEMNLYRHSPYFLIDLDEIWCRIFPCISVEQLRGCEKRVLLRGDVNEILLVFFLILFPHLGKIHYRMCPQRFAECP
jgi:hypothetical protein